MNANTNSGTYTTVNSSTSITVAMESVSHIIEHVSNDTAKPDSTTWIHFQSGKSVHVDAPYKDVQRTFIASLN